jgi:hypothetical protein
MWNTHGFGFKIGAKGFLNVKIYAKTRIIGLEFEKLVSNLHTHSLLKKLVSKLGPKILLKEKN